MKASLLNAEFIMGNMDIAGAWCSEEGVCRFKVWAPLRSRMALRLLDQKSSSVEMRKDGSGYFVAEVTAAPGTKYLYVPDEEKSYPDPASQFQPDGVHGPSQIVAHNNYKWNDDSWRGIPLRELVLYELHVGTFTPEGTFDAIIPRLDALSELGVNAIELMPVAQFPGNRNWGYDGAFPYAVQNSYGGPEGLKRLVNACHQKRIAVFLDVVYNHMGPEGNYLAQFGPYFTNQYCTPWGDAINFDGEWSDGVKDYFINNVLFWFEVYHIDGLRLDAIHTIFDANAVSFWDLLYERRRLLEQKLGRHLYLTAESDLNSPKVVKAPEVGGYGFDAQWLDDFHHSLYVILHRKGRERYEDFGAMEQLAKAYTDGFVHSGEYVKFRKRRHGISSAGVPADRFIVFNQNHDQVGNRVKGERLCMLVDTERVKLAAAAVLLSPYIPMLFMGEEYADESPFFYFVSHSDEELVKAVREGRKKEFEDFKGEGEPLDAQDEETYRKSRLQWNKRGAGKHMLVLDWHRQLIALRRSHPVLRNFCKNDIRATVIDEHGLVLHRQTEGGLQHLLCLFNFSDGVLHYTLPANTQEWEKILDSKQDRWMEHGAEGLPAPGKIMAGQQCVMQPCSVVVYGSEAMSLIP